jgi:hypothetical protein
MTSARRHVAWWVVAMTLFLAPVTVTVLKVTGQRHDGTDVPRRQFVDAVRALPGERKIVFVRYPAAGPCRQPEQGLIDNAPPLATEPTWIVYDRGAEDAELVRAAGDRAPYVFDVETGSLRPMR